LLFTEEAAGLATHNQADANARHGLYLGHRATPFARENVCRRNVLSDVVTLGEVDPVVSAAPVGRHRLTLEAEGGPFELALPFELKPNERAVLENLARYGRMSEAALGKAVGTRRIGGLLESLVERLNRAGFLALGREGDGPEGNVYELRRDRL